MKNLMKLGSLTSIRTGKLDANASSENGKYPFFTCSKEPLRIDSYSYNCECVLVAGNGDLNVKYYDGKFDAYQRTYIIESTDKSKLLVKYLYFFLDIYVDVLRTQSIGGVIKYIKLGNLTDAMIPLPSIEEQAEIVDRLEKCNDLIYRRIQQLTILDQLVKSRFIELFGDIHAPSKWEKKPWSELVTIQNGRDYKNILVESGGYPVYGTGGEMARASGYLCPENTIIVGRKGTINNPLLVKEKFWNVDTAFGVIAGNPLHYQYFYNFCRMFDFSTLNKQAVLPSTTKADLLKIEIAVPPMELQEQFAAFVEQTDKSKLAVQKSVEQLETLKKSLMQQYFG